jgi:hypothetical protein
MAALSLLGALFVGCSGSGSPAASPRQSRTTTITRSGEDTIVSIDETEKEPVNPVCTSYCDRVAACWYARGGADLMMTKEEIVSRCQREQADCRTPTTDMLCCSQIADCYDFNRCLVGARDVVMACERARGIERTP